VAFCDYSLKSGLIAAFLFQRFSLIFISSRRSTTLGRKVKLFFPSHGRAIVAYKYLFVDR
jgi:hypothetical protein